MKKILDRFNSLNVAVIGDVMLDIFTYGISERLSPEAPVPVIRIFKKEYCPGGAGNVAENLAALDVKCSLFGVVGADIDGEKLSSCFKSGNIGTYLFKDASRPTTVKERFVANQQQLLRVDAENTKKNRQQYRKLFRGKHLKTYAARQVECPHFLRLQKRCSLYSTRSETY